MIREIDSVEALESLRSEWLALWRRSVAATPFQSPDWLIPWWKHFGVGRLCVLALSDGQRLVGVAPLFADRGSLRFVGTGNTDYSDVLFEKRVVWDGVAAIFMHLGTNRWWDEIDLENLRHDSPLLTTNKPAGLFAYVEEQDCCPVLSLPASADEFLNVLPTRLQHNLSYYGRKLATFGKVKIERAEEHNFAELFAALLSLHQARWRINDLPGMLCDDNVQSFLRDAAKGLLANGALRLYGLRIDTRIIASLYGFHHAGRTYYYLGGFDPEFRKYSPGTILVAHAIAEAIREEAREFDFLRGREDYKYRWGAIDRKIYRQRVERIKSYEGLSRPTRSQDETAGRALDNWRR